MKNKFLKKIGSFLQLVMLNVLVFVIPSCLKDRVGTDDYSKSPALVSFQYAGFKPVPFTASILGTPQDSLSVEVTLSVASITLNSPVTATISADNGSLTGYNNDTTTSSYPTKFIQLPVTQFTLENAGKVTINPGQQIVSFRVNFAGDKIDFSKDNALALKITDAQGATIATNLNIAIIIVKLKSIYEGNYTGTGARIRYKGGTTSAGILDSSSVKGVISFSTLGLKIINGQLGDAGSGYSMALKVNDTGTAPYAVDVMPDPATVGSGGSPSAIIPGTSRGQSTYDPVTKTFDLHFGYLNGSGNLRQVNEVLVYTP